MSNLCRNYITKMLNKNVTGMNHETKYSSDDYGFLLPNGGVISMEAKRQLKPVSLPNEVASHQHKNTELTCKSLHQDTEDSGYLSPVHSSKHNSTLSPIYFSIDTPSVNNTKPTKQLPNIVTESSKIMDDSVCSSVNSSTLSSKTSKCRRSLLRFYNGKEKEGSDYYIQQQPKMTVGEIESTLNAATTNQPASVLLMVVRSHIPRTANSGEVKVTRGALVTGLYKTSEWVNVKLSNSISGYIPYECVQPVGIKMHCKSSPNEQYPVNITTVQNSMPKTFDVVSPSDLGQPRYRYSHAGYSSDDTYVQADGLYERLYINDNEIDELLNRDSYEKNNNSNMKKIPITPPPRCKLTETIEQSKKFINNCNNISRNKMPFVASGDWTLAPGLSKGILGHFGKRRRNTIDNISSIDNTTSSVHPEDSKLNENIMNNNNNTDTQYHRCYICKGNIKLNFSPPPTTDSYHTINGIKREKKYTCTNCVLSQLHSSNTFNNTQSNPPPQQEQDFGYESAKSETGAASNLNTQLAFSSTSDLIQSIETLNISEDSGKDSCCSYSEISYRLAGSIELSSVSSKNKNNNRGRESNLNNFESSLDDDDDFYSDSVSLSTISTEAGANLTVLFNYSQCSSHDLSLKKQDVVTLLYDKHDSWYWVRNSEGKEGYVPKNYVVNLEKLNLDPTTKTTYL